MDTFLYVITSPLSWKGVQGGGLQLHVSTAADIALHSALSRNGLRH